MDYFKTHNNRGHLLYNNYLVWNLPCEDIQASIDSLKQGKLYDKYGGYVLRTFVKDLKSGGEEVYNHCRFDNEDGPVVTLIIDEKFNMIRKNTLKRANIIITDGRENVQSYYPAIVDWLAPHLEALGFAAHAVKKSHETIWLKKGLYDAWVATQQ